MLHANIDANVVPHRSGGVPVLLRATAARSGGLCSDLRRGRRRTKGQGRSRLLAMVRCERAKCSGFAHCLPIRDVRRRSSSPEFRALGRQSCECANSAWVTNVTSLREFARHRSVRPSTFCARRPRSLSPSFRRCEYLALASAVRLTPSRRCSRGSVPLPTRADRLLGEREDLRAGENRWCS